MPEIKIKKQIIFDERGIFGYIDVAPKKSLSSKIAKKEFRLTDIYDNKYTCYLRVIVRLGSIIPEVLSYHAEGRSPESTTDILSQRGIDITKPLAYYLFMRK